MVATSYIAGVVVLLATFLPLLGIHVGSAELTTTVQTIVDIVSGIVIIVHQLNGGHSTVFGTTPQKPGN